MLSATSYCYLLPLSPTALPPTAISYRYLLPLLSIAISYARATARVVLIRRGAVPGLCSYSLYSRLRNVRYARKDVVGPVLARELQAEYEVSCPYAKSGTGLWYAARR